MTIPDTEEFKHLTSYIFGDGSPTQQYCSQANVNTHRKLKAKLKSSIESGTALEYTDPETSATVKLSEDDIYEINAIQSFKAFMQNETGPKKTRPLDITEFSRDDFTSYLTDDYDPDNPDVYVYKIAVANRQNIELHEAQMKLNEVQMQKLASTTANVMISGGATTTSSSGGGSNGGGNVSPIDPFATERKAFKKLEAPDSKAFTLFEHDDEFSSWYKPFQNTATLQGFKNLLDPTYVPATAEEKEFFTLRQKHLWATQGVTGVGYSRVTLTWGTTRLVP